MQHEIIEAAKRSFKEDPAMPFVQHLEMHARDLCRPRDEWRWETSSRAGGVWSVDVEYVPEKVAAAAEARLL
jgi:hypothetical protein